MLNFYKYSPYNNNYLQKNHSYNQSDFQYNRQIKNTPNNQSSIIDVNKKNQHSSSQSPVPSSREPHPPPSISKPPPPPCRPPKRKNLPPKKKFNFKSLKKDTCTSLNDVECFLNNFSNFIKYVKLINLLK